VQTTIFSDPTAQDTPIFVEQGALRNITLITMLLMPFGILGLGVYVWWSNRERERVSR
jgi:hypothetical protein